MFVKQYTTTSVYVYLPLPSRFAEFVEGDSWHVTNEELLEYDSGPDPTPPHLISDDEEGEDDEMDFILNSPWCSGDGFYHSLLWPLWRVDIL